MSQSDQNLRLLLHCHNGKAILKGMLKILKKVSKQREAKNSLELKSNQILAITSPSCFLGNNHFYPLLLYLLFALSQGNLKSWDFLVNCHPCTETYLDGPIH